MPDRHRGTVFDRNDEAAVAWRRALDALRQQDRLGRGMFVLMGPNGRGKTQLAVEVVRALCAITIRCLYATAQAVASDFTDAAFTGRLAETFARYSAPQMLVLDDVQNVALTDTARTRLVDLVDMRYRAERGLLLVTNQTESALAESLGNQVMQRVAECGGYVRCTWPALRRGA